jgi:hypothetical protein
MARYLFMWLAFVVLFSAAVTGLEVWEGNKITTTEYYGLRNIGLIYLAVTVLPAVGLYPVTLLPLSVLIRKVIKPLPVRLFLYGAAGSLGGIRMFRSLYDDYFVRGYGLNVSSSVLVFGAFGLAYALADHYIASRHPPVRR